MADALVTVVLTQLATILDQQIRQQIKLVVGVSKEINNLTTTLQSIQALLVDADKRHVHEKSVKLWVEKLRNVSYEMDDVLADWSTAILKLQIDGIDRTTNDITKKKVCFFISSPCFSVQRVVARRDIALEIKRISASLNEIAVDKERYTLNTTADAAAGSEQLPVRVRTTSAVDVAKVCGRDDDMNALVSKLCESNEGLHVVAIVGLGGIGKTTLAQLIYQCTEVSNHFQRKMWVCVSDVFDEIRVAKAIVEDAEGTPPNCAEYEVALRYVRECIRGKTFLLVLDDVWSQDSARWEPLLVSLKSGAPGSKILITTRNEKVAKTMGLGATSYSTTRLGVLSAEDCWSLFSQIAFSDRTAKECEKLEDMGRRIAAKCKGLPLAAKTTGSLMRFKTTGSDWQHVVGSDLWQLDDAESSLFPALLLSYYDLPSAMKRCFLYCATFPKDHKIEADNLIKLWMAQGYLTSRGSVEMEVTGRDYLDNLIMRSFFQDLEKDKDGDIVVRFKMHDMVHDFAQQLTKNECFIMEASSGTEQGLDLNWQKLRHLTIVRGEEAKFPVPPDSTERLHTFWVQAFYDSPPIVIQNNIAPTGLFHQLKYLKALDLSRNKLTELPGEVGKLMHLRYLNLSHNPLFELPETVCGLCNLQTLKLIACDHLAKLPSKMEKLVNLRHLEVDRTESLRTLPKGIGLLTSLRTLSKFTVGSGPDTGEASCKLGDLRDLKLLRGCLKLEGVGHVEDVCDAENAELKNKEHILDLHIDFNTLVPAKRAKDVVEALQLHPNLQSLQMKLYGGYHFPSWMVSLTSLRKLRLMECKNCIKLPPLGKLPSLEILYIESMDSLIRVDHELLGTDGTTRGSLSSFVAFPKLKKLKFTYMRSWEEWDMISAAGQLEGIMPCLRYLKLSHCDKIKTLPQPLLQITQLKKFRVNHCPALRQRYQKDTGEDWISISHISKIRIS